MRKWAGRLAVVALILVSCASAPSKNSNGNSNDNDVFNSARRLAKESPQELRGMIQDQINALYPFVETGGLEMLKRFRSNFPHFGIGASIVPKAEVKQLGDGRIFFYKGAVIDSLLKDSPASRAGLRKNDWIISVNGKEVSPPPVLVQIFDQYSAKEMEEANKTLAENPQVQSALRQYAELALELLEGESGTVTLVIERGEERKEITIEKQMVGEEIASFIDQNLDGWEKSFRSYLWQLQELEKQLAAAGDNPDGLFACFVKVDEITSEVAKPWKELDKFFEP